jgi:hypothetical protein
MYRRAVPRSRTNWVATNTATGEQMPMYHGKRYPIPPFSMLFLEQMDRLWPLTGTELKVLLLVLAAKPVDQTLIAYDVDVWAQRLDTSDRVIWRALNSLEHQGLIRRPKRQLIELDPRIGWRGGSKAYNEELAKVAGYDWETEEAPDEDRDGSGGGAAADG